jgi:spore germination cell wall hydrolase CwlJ-like protein
MSKKRIMTVCAAAMALLLGAALAWIPVGPGQTAGITTAAVAAQAETEYISIAAAPAEALETEAPAGGAAVPKEPEQAPNTELKADAEPAGIPKLAVKLKPGSVCQPDQPEPPKKPESAVRPGPAEKPAVKGGYSLEEMKLIARVVYAESRGEPFKGQVAVAVVVLNRYESGKFGNSIRSVVYAKSQFAVGSRYNEQNMRAVEEAISCSDFPGTMFYFRTSTSKTWRSLIYYCRIGNHSFFLAAK